MFSRPKYVRVAPLFHWKWLAVSLFFGYFAVNYPWQKETAGAYFLCALCLVIGAPRLKIAWIGGAILFVMALLNAAVTMPR